MPITTAVAITNAGDRLLYEMDDQTGRLLFALEEEPPPPPQSLVNSAWVRRLLQDPPGLKMAILVDVLPAAGVEGYVYYKQSPYDGAAWAYDALNGWREAETRFTNAAVDEAVASYGDAHMAALALLSEWEGSIDIDAFYTSANSGAESVTWPSLTERSAWFIARKKAINDLFLRKAGKTGAAWASIRPPMVGGEW
jgi:hypothetical protein